MKKLIKKRYYQLSEKEKSFLKRAYKESLNESGFSKNILCRILFAKFSLIYDDEKIIGSASVLFNRLDHIFMTNKGSGYGSFLLNEINVKYVQVRKGLWKTQSLVNFYKKMALSKNLH